MAQTNSSGNETSIKQLFQGMMPVGEELMEGTVIQTGPLKIQITGDDKLIINERITVVPWHLTDYKTRATYRKMDGELDSWTKPDNHHEADGCKHYLEDYNLYKGIIVVHNALRVGDKLHILSLNNGKLYYVLDRVAGQEVI